MQKRKRDFLNKGYVKIFSFYDVLSMILFILRTKEKSLLLFLSLTHALVVSVTLSRLP